MRRRLGLAGWLVVGLAVLVSCRRSESCIGVLLPETGAHAFWGRQARQGIELALAERPEGERPLVLFADGKSSPRDTTEAFDALVDRGASIVIGPLTTDNALAAGAVAHAREVPFVTPSATGLEVTRDNPYALRFCYTDQQVARALAHYARKDLGLERLVVVVDLANRYSLGLGHEFTREFVGMWQGRVVEQIAYYDDPEELAGVLDRVAALDVEGAFVAGYHDELMAMLRGATDPRVADLVLLGADGWEGAGLAAALDGRVAGAYYTSHFCSDEARPEVTRFLAAYRARYGGEPESDFVALAYDTARAVLSRFDAGADGDTMRRRLAAHPFVGATGPVTLDGGGDPESKSLVLEQLHDASRSRFVKRHPE